MTKKDKKIIYYILWIFAGILMSVLAIGMLQLFSIIYGVQIEPDWLSAFLTLCILVLGLLFGIWAGVESWNKIYVQGVRGEKYTKEHKERFDSLEKKFFQHTKGLTIDTVMKWTLTIFLIYLIIITTVVVACFIAAAINMRLDGAMHVFYSSIIIK